MATRLYRVGGFATDTVTDVINLAAMVSTSGRVSTFRLNTGTAGYAVTTAKTLYIAKIVVANYDVSATSISVSIGYADNDVGLDVTTARTNPINVFGYPEATTAATAGGILFQGNQSHQWTPANSGLNNLIIKAAPAGKYLYTKVIGVVPIDVQLWCFEI